MENANKVYKVIIIGAGPAGISTALNLLKCGVNNLLIVEKSRFPRYKCCAGYITEKTRAAYFKLGIDTKDCRYSLIKDFNVFYKGKKRLNVVNKFLYTNADVDRVELDYNFYKKAKSSGVEILENTTITSHSLIEKTLALSNGQVLSYENIVFADGTNGFGSRYQKNKKCNIALQLIFESDRAQAIDIHFGVTKRGYAWVSSFDRKTNVGMTDVYKKAKPYKQIFANFLKEQNLTADADKITAAFTPIGTRKPIIARNAYFVGDAVGACDPLTLSGLRYSLLTGEYCAKAIAQNKPAIYKKCVRKLKTKFFFTSFMQKVFYLRGALYFTFNFLCRCFGKTVSRIFNNYFVNKK